VRERRATFAATPEQDALRPDTVTQWKNLVLAGDPDNDRARYYLGATYVELKSEDKALEAFELVVVHLRRGRFDQGGDRLLS